MLKQLNMIAALILLIYLGACSSPSSEIVFTFGEFANPINLDAAVVIDNVSFRTIKQGCEGLMKFAPGTTEPIVSLAESYTVTDDGLMWTFKLHEGVKFHDGTDFNAEAVKWNFDRWRFTDNPYHYPELVFEYYQAQFNGFDDDSIITNVEVANPNEIVITLSDPNGAFLNNLAMINFSIASPSAIKAAGADYGTPSVGFSCTGPYKFVSWENGVKTVLEKNTEYWGETTGNINKIIFTQIPDSAARFAALKGGTIDAFESPNVEDILSIESDENLYVQFRPSFNVFYLAFNYRIREFRDPKVRQAVSLAINRQEIVDSYYASAVVANTKNPPSIAIGFNPDVVTPFDPEAAIALLAEAGYPDGIAEVNVLALDADGNVTDTVESTLPFHLFFMPIVRPYNPDGEGIGELMAAYLQEVGIDAKLASAGDWATYLDKRRTGDLLGLYQFGWTGDNGDPDNFIGYFFASIDEPLSREGYYQNAEIAALLQQARALTDPTERNALYQQAEALLAADHGRIFIAHGQVPMAFNKKVSGFVLSPLGDEAFDSIVIGS